MVKQRVVVKRRKVKDKYIQVKRNTEDKSNGNVTHTCCEGEKQSRREVDEKNSRIHKEGYRLD